MADWLSQHASAIATITAALVAAVASLFAAFLARRTQRQQINLQVDVEQRLTEVRDTLERERSFGVFSRDRIAAHLDAVLRAIIELTSMAHLVGKRTWVDRADHLETERAIYSAIQSVKVNVWVLFALRAVGEQLHDKAVGKTGPVWWEWGRVMDEVTLLNADFRKANPTEREFSPKAFNERWQALNAAVTELENTVVELPAAILLPK